MLVKWKVDIRNYWNSWDILKSALNQFTSDDSIRHDVGLKVHLEDAKLALASRILQRKFVDRLPNNCSIERSATGRPYVSCHGVDFNVSHHDGIVVLVGSHNGGSPKIGVDIVRATAPPSSDEDWLEAFEDVFSSTELSNMRGLDYSGRLDLFWTNWALKEALVKATGEGLSANLRLINFGDFPRRNTSSEFDLQSFNGVEINGRLSTEWSFEIHSHPNYIIAVAFTDCREAEGVTGFEEIHIP